VTELYLRSGRICKDYSFIAWGRYGRFVFVSPRTGLVIVRTGSKTGIEPQLRREIFQYIVDRMG